MNRPRSAPLAAVAFVLIAIAAGVWLRARPPRTARTTAPVTAPPSAAAQLPTLNAALMVTLGTSRERSPAFEVSLPGDAPGLELHARLDPADRFDSYSMELRSESGSLVWQSGNLTASTEEGAPVLIGTTPSRLLRDGTYELAALASIATVSRQTLGWATINVRR